MPKQQTNIRLSLHSKHQLHALAHKLGLSEGQLITLAIDRMARDEGLTPRRQLWRHRQSGEVYVVRVLGSEVLEAAGPLYASEQDRAIMDGFDGDPKVTEDIREAAGDFVLHERQDGGDIA